MNYIEETASPALCEELSKLIKWDDTYWNYWRSRISQDKWVKSHRGAIETREVKERIPAYTTGYLLRKLAHLYPHLLFQRKGVISKDPMWVAFPIEDDGLFMQIEDTPENVLVKLCIKLIKEGEINGKPGRPDAAVNSQSVNRRTPIISDSDQASIENASENNSGSLRNSG